MLRAFLPMFQCAHARFTANGIAKFSPTDPQHLQYIHPSFPTVVLWEIDRKKYSEAFGRTLCFGVLF
jgi:hypothetical protein